MPCLTPMQSCRVCYPSATPAVPAGALLSALSHQHQWMMIILLAGAARGVGSKWCHLLLAVEGVGVRVGLLAGWGLLHMEVQGDRWILTLISAVRKTLQHQEGVPLAVQTPPHTSSSSSTVMACMSSSCCHSSSTTGCSCTTACRFRMTALSAPWRVTLHAGQQQHRLDQRQLLPLLAATAWAQLPAAGLLVLIREHLLQLGLCKGTLAQQQLLLGQVLTKTARLTPQESRGTIAPWVGNTAGIPALEDTRRARTGLRRLQPLLLKLPRLPVKLPYVPQVACWGPLALTAAGRGWMRVQAVRGMRMG